MAYLLCVSASLRLCVICLRSSGATIWYGPGAIEYWVIVGNCLTLSRGAAEKPSLVVVVVPAQPPFFAFDAAPYGDYLLCVSASLCDLFTIKRSNDLVWPRGN